MTNPEQPAPEGERWYRYSDNYSEHYEVTDTDRDRASIYDGHLFKMGDKDSANELVDYLNALESEAQRLREQVKLGQEIVDYLDLSTDIGDGPQDLYFMLIATDWPARWQALQPPTSCSTRERR